MQILDQYSAPVRYPYDYRDDLLGAQNGAVQDKFRSQRGASLTMQLFGVYGSGSEVLELLWLEFGLDGT